MSRVILDITPEKWNTQASQGISGSDYGKTAEGYFKYEYISLKGGMFRLTTLKYKDKYLQTSPPNTLILKVTSYFTKTEDILLTFCIQTSDKCYYYTNSRAGTAVTSGTEFDEF